VEGKMTHFFDELDDILLTTGGIARYYAFSKMFDYKSSQEITHYVDELEKRMKDFCLKNISFYQKNGTEMIINKDQVLQNYNELVFPPYNNRRRSVFFKTSGSTGKRLNMILSKKHWIVEQTAFWKYLKVTGYKFREPMAIFRSYTPKEDEPFFKYDQLRNFLYISPYHITEKNIQQIYDLLRQYKIVYLRGYPSSIYLVAKLFNAQGIRLKHIKAVLVASETLYDYQKEYIEQYFDTKIYNWYGQVEGTANIFSCEKGHLHINEEYGAVKLAPLREEEHLYKIVATQLRNYSLPLVNYDTGDVVQYVPNFECSCGRNTRVIERIYGREGDYLLSDSGNFLPVTNIYTFFSKLDVIKEFQVVQESNNRVYITIDLLNHTEDEQVSNIMNTIAKYFENTLQIRDYKITIDRVNKINDGKLRAVYRTEKVNL